MARRSAVYRHRTRANEARASRRDAPAHLTPGHWQEPRVVSVLATIGAFEAHPAPELGRGNFGIGYPVRLRDGTPAILKVAAPKSIHGRPWTRAEQEANLMHEAGVANELRALGFRVVPDTVYAHLADGTPAILREYGHPTGPISYEDAMALEESLVALEDIGWNVHDEIALFRREDGTLFVSDVGIWQFDPNRDFMHRSDLLHLLKPIHPSLPSLADAITVGESVRRTIELVNVKKAKGLPIGQHLLRPNRRDAPYLAQWIADRDAQGLSVPSWLRPLPGQYNDAAAVAVAM